MSDIPADGIPAATLVIFRRGPGGAPPELLMVTRANFMKFAAGAAVFPGGRVDQADRDLAERQNGIENTDEAAHRIAAIRETLEETGLAVGLVGDIDAERAAEARRILHERDALAPVLEMMDWSLDLEAIVPFARWFPKNERLPRVFDTRFYLADLGTGAVDIAVDATENTHLFWITARDALAAADRGEISVIFPTRRNLERLAQFDDFDAALTDCAAHPPRTIIPFFEEHDGEGWICIPDDAGYPVTRERLQGLSRG
ncbi:NUDIX hydrolase [Altererythrobacter sp. C41]|uniref:NUDIX hydrolase n=1 Tax=Altererythrobacter sp. C41 TaxID=2806021 RepID=UPI001931284E|nr:NUDIX domain-containing protein [Altererythrobacter sp. C41]MBM0169942.1 NUDIX domain-containing protein [Altererythrobacter sp. C41]